ncbi:HlyD family type I secretion periplasmic adaptor subunit [Bosea caraganae]|uniref:Membrane fusion protein (MFP) family protein n=1 Tax=Bosea caraganae TaxID=2763117 RepID=A0A370L234_9HYPH|nr:HlyD family type I secretion periplasmic adaptor subunit [Bosea caraganae]RDJ22203.1 HlyD family type I secretion periplasmic adaptor subunit [Bosea caraganae]RDJ22710.1 HlyD family type I secretion periplasmic adaptor subunit [Bosea caraganae]
MTEAQPWYSDVPRSARAATISGVVIVAVTVMGFGVWGNTAPISGAVIATGVFVTTGQNKTIQHLEGGVIREIMVREGDVVAPGQLLIQLDDTSSRAELRRHLLKQLRLEAIETRLSAEAAGQPQFEFPAQLLTHQSDPDIRALMQTQKSTFTARQNNNASEIATYQKSIEALEEKIAGSRIQLAAMQQQSQLIKEELAGKQALLERGYIRKPEVLALQRNAANLQGEAGRITGDIGDARERIARSVEQIDGVRKSAIKLASEQLQDIGADLNDVRERIHTAKGILDRARVVAPVKGTVVKLRYHTSGGVIEAGKAIMEIVSLQDELIIEARVRPQDIDKIKHSQTATVRLTALNQRTTPMINGRVIYISADALPDEKQRTPNGSDLYVVRVRLEGGSIAAVHDFEPTPGMPAEVYIQTAERTFFEYLMQPIKDSMARAFRET